MLGFWWDCYKYFKTLSLARLDQEGSCSWIWTAIKKLDCGYAITYITTGSLIMWYCDCFSKYHVGNKACCLSALLVFCLLVSCFYTCDYCFCLAAKRVWIFGSLCWLWLLILTRKWNRGSWIRAIKRNFWILNSRLFLELLQITFKIQISSTICKSNHKGITSLYNLTFWYC